MAHIKGGATRIIEGIQRFQENVFSEKESLFRRLSEGHWLRASCVCTAGFITSNPVR
jgi:hypothetical protein